VIATAAAALAGLISPAWADVLPEGCKAQSIQAAGQVFSVLLILFFGVPLLAIAKSFTGWIRWLALIALLPVLFIAAAGLLGGPDC
jgi:hypothetical protein